MTVTATAQIMPDNVDNAFLGTGASMLNKNKGDEQLYNPIPVFVKTSLDKVEGVLCGFVNFFRSLPGSIT